MKKIILFILVFLISACAKTFSPELPQEEQTSSAWLKMLNLSKSVSPAPWKTQLSLRFGAGGETRRVTGIMWGNNENEIRLDVMAGIGAVIAMIQENDSQFVMLVPQTGKAYVHHGKSPLFKIGIPFPFDLPKLAQLLAGNYGSVFGTTFKEIETENSQQATFKLAANSPAKLRLNSDGYPEAWTEGQDGWQMKITYDNGQNKLPQKITLERPDGKRAILLVKDRETNIPAYSPAQLQLELPPNIPLLPLAQYSPG